MTLVTLTTALCAGVSSQQGAAFLIIDVPSGRRMAESRADVLRAPMLPGSIAKVAVIAGALDAGRLAADTTLFCTRSLRIDGRTYTCSHPDLRRPLTPADALAHSCNTFVATVARRVGRQNVNAGRARMGLAPLADSVPLVEGALGLAGPRSTPEELLWGVTRIFNFQKSLDFQQRSGFQTSAGFSPATVAVLRDGMARAAREGTGGAFARAGLDALVKTGTAPARGGYIGLAVALEPAARPTRAIIVVAAGAAGRDAAEIAATELERRAPRVSASTIRLGVARPSTSLGRPESAGGSAAGGYDTRDLPLDEYVAGVLAGEAVPRSAPAALEALAVTVRTFALANAGRHRSQGFDVCDLTHCQVFRPATDAMRRAAAATAGRVLAHAGRLAGVFYTASCGGHTERAAAVWPGAEDSPFLPARPDPACGGAPEWSADIDARDLTRALNAAGFRGMALGDLRPLARTPSGRVDRLRITGLTPSEISGQDLRMAVGRALGWQLVRSTAFAVTRTARGYHFSGRGAGHGVGLCVVGSARMAEGGASAARILETYFPGATLSSLAGAPSLAPARPAVAIVLSRTEEPLRPALQSLSTDVFGRLVSRIGELPEGGIPTATLRFHPTVESYRRATGRPWWIAASTSGTEVQLLPASVLRQRGILEQTIAHEMAHVLSAPALAGRPLWVQEGVAMYLAAENAGAVAGRLACPSDAELRDASSAGALRAAYARAAACVAAELKKGLRWDQVGR